MRRIPLVHPEDSSDKIWFAQVDDQDYDRVKAAGPWRYHKGYAARRDPNYTSISKKGAMLLMHRLILHADERPDTVGFLVDHKDGNRLNNCRANLGVVTYLIQI